MSNPTVTFEIPNGDKPVKWTVQTPDQVRANTLAYRIAGLDAVVDAGQVTAVVQQALAVVGLDGKYTLTAVKELTVLNEYGRTAQLGWRVKTEGHDGLLEVRLTFTYPTGWAVDVIGQGITHELGLDVSKALSLVVTAEVNASKLPPAESPFTPAVGAVLDEAGEPVVMPKEAPPVGSLLTQEDKDRLDIEDAKARATAAGFTVDE